MFSKNREDKHKSLLSKHELSAFNAKKRKRKNKKEKKKKKKKNALQTCFGANFMEAFA